MYSHNLGSTKATSNLLLHLKESLIYFILCLDMFYGVVIFNITTDFTRLDIKIIAIYLT